jgi:hypothetical protein
MARLLRFLALLVGALVIISAVIILYEDLLKHVLFRRGPAFKTIPRVKEDDLTFSFFRDNYLLPGVPLVIEVNTSIHSSLTIVQELLDKCGEKETQLFSETTLFFLRNLTPSMRVALDNGLKLLLSVGLDEWIESRGTMTLSEFNATINSQAGKPRGGLLFKLIAPFLSTTHARMLQIASLPPYLSDVGSHLTCAEALGYFPFGTRKGQAGGDWNSDPNLMDHSKSPSELPIETLGKEFMQPQKDKPLGDWKVRAYLTTFSYLT